MDRLWLALMVITVVLALIVIAGMVIIGAAWFPRMLPP